MRLATLLLAAVICLVAVAPAGAASPAEYREAVSEALAIVRQSLEQGDPAPEVAAAHATRALERVRTVESGDGRPVPVDAGWILAYLQKSPPDLRRAETRLQVLLRELEARPAAATEVGRAEDALRREAARLDRSRDQPMFWDGWLSTLREWLAPLGRWLNELLRIRPSDAGDRAAVPIWATGVLALAVVVGALALVARSLRRSVVPGSEEESAAAEAEHRASREYLARAHADAAAGRFRDAVRALYLATVLHLDERALIPFDPTLTNREYLSLAVKEGRLFSLLRPLIQVFDSSWYGRQACTRSEFEECCRLAREIGLAV